ncbi:MAG: transcriptional regulator [Cyanobacteria bacterium P01_F01_bin.86]
MSQQRELDVVKRDRYELLSAYLDGEVSPDERRLVMTWLSDDPDAQCLYRRLLHLRQSLHGMYQLPNQSSTADCTATAVVGRLNYQHRFKFTCMAGLTATAVAFIGVFSGALNQPMGTVGQLQTSAPSSAGDSLEIALDQPPITIPKSAVSAQTAPMESVLPQPGSGISSSLESEL